MATGAKFLRIGLRVAILAAACVVGFYIGRPLYWKLTATVQELRESDYKVVKQGFSDLVSNAQNTVRWGTGTMTEETVAIKDPGKEGGESSPSNGSRASVKPDLTSKTEDSKASNESDKAKSNETRKTRRLNRRLLFG